MEVVSAVGINFLNLVVVYAPIFFLLWFVEQFEDYRSKFPARMHIITTTCYTIATCVYPLLCIAFDQFGNPWRHLRILQSTKKNSIEMNKKRDNSRHEGNRVPVGGIDAVDPRSFLVRAQEEVQEKQRKRNVITKSNLQSK